MHIIHRPFLVEQLQSRRTVALSLASLLFKLLVDPGSPLAPCAPFASLPFPLVPDRSQVAHILPIPASACPSCLSHETDNCLFLRPSLLDGHIRKVCGTKTSAVVGEGEAEAMSTQIPVEGVCAGREGAEKRDVVCQGR